MIILLFLSTGPLAKNVLSELTDVDLSTKGFPFFSYREIDLGLANGIRAMNLTHTGELGWVLYIPNEVNSTFDLNFWFKSMIKNCLNLVNFFLISIS